MEPITRQEKFLNSIATGDSVELEPITREEMYLSAIAGSTESKPEKPITRKEMFYEKILESGGVGGDGTAKPEQSKTIEVTENGTYKITPDSGKVLSSATAKVNVPERYEEGFQAGVDSVKLQEKTATENGDVLPDEGFNGMSKVTVAVPTGSGKEEQEKSITITENGTTEVTPDEGKTLSKVTIETTVSGGGEVGKPYLDTRLIKSFANFFDYGVRKELLPLLGVIIDTSESTSFTAMFSEYSSYGDFEIPLFDTSKGKEFSNMFKDCAGLTTIPRFNTSAGKKFDYMFAGCRALISVPLFDIENGTSFRQMFSSCSNLENLSLGTPKGDFETYTFQGCTALTNLTIGEGWAVNIYLTFSNKLTVESLHGMIENLADLTGKTAKKFQVGATNLAKIDADHIAMLQTKNWNYS